MLTKKNHIFVVTCVLFWRLAHSFAIQYGRFIPCYLLLQKAYSGVDPWILEWESWCLSRFGLPQKLNNPFDPNPELILSPAFLFAKHLEQFSDLFILLLFYVDSRHSTIEYLNRLLLYCCTLLLPWSDVHSYFNKGSTSGCSQSGYSVVGPLCFTLVGVVWGVLFADFHDKGKVEGSPNLWMESSLASGHCLDPWHGG